MRIANNMQIVDCRELWLGNAWCIPSGYVINQWKTGVETFTELDHALIFLLCFIQS